MTLPTPFYEREGIRIYVGDNREVLPHIEPVHAVVTDPPYDLTQRAKTTYKSAFPGRYKDHKPGGGFMGMKWDATGIAFDPVFWQAIGEAMLPGAHLLAFGGTRTYHRMAVAIEDAGYEIRDTLQWLYGSGFPKSHDVSKAIDKMAGAEREVISREVSRFTATGRNERYGKLDYFETDEKGREIRETTAPATPAAEQWQGWGTALKPAYEPIIMARLPFKGTVAANVLEHGTGAINVDACRIEGAPPSVPQPAFNSPTGQVYGFQSGEGRNGEMSQASGRWPANVILDEAAAAALDAQSGASTSKRSRRGDLADHRGDNYNAANGRRIAGSDYERGHNDTGGASRFFYVAKSSRRDRSANGTVANTHPTCKPTTLMKYLIQMVTPPGGVVLDPFAGSGSTLVAAAELGFNAIGIELSEEYAEIAARRVDHAIENRDPQLALEGIA